MKKNEVVYVPSIGIGQLKAGLKYKLGKHRLGWWLPDGIISHKYILMSAFYSLNGGSLIRKKYEIGSDTTLIIDSGGFQQMSLDENLGQMRVLRHQEDIGDIGFVLDKPPIKIVHKESHSDVKPVKWDEMIQCAKATVKNAKLIEEKRDNNNKIGVFNVMQGSSDFSRMEAWYDIVKEANLDGWAVAPKPPSDPVGIARGLIFAHNNNFKNIHVLGVSGVTTMPILSFMGNFFDTNITFDTASSSLEAKAYSIYRFHYNDKRTYFGKNRITYIPTKMKSLPCDCPVCNFLNEQENPTEIFHNTSDYSSNLMMIHNLHETIKTINYLNSIRDDENIFLPYLKSRNNRVMQAYDEINYYMNHGYEALKKRIYGVRKQGSIL